MLCRIGLASFLTQLQQKQRDVSERAFKLMIIGLHMSLWRPNHFLPVLVSII